MRELDRETERRWKAEQAAIKLAEHVRTLQLQGMGIGYCVVLSSVHVCNGTSLLWTPLGPIIM